MNDFENDLTDYQTTPPLYPPEDPAEAKKSPQHPHRRSANANIFQEKKSEV